MVLGWTLINYQLQLQPQKLLPPNQNVEDIMDQKRNLPGAIIFWSYILAALVFAEKHNSTITSTPQTCLALRQPGAL
ncbi:hypothetical protein AC578_5821 [Pseudocercospora eumusae]|uniref:Uncharacterized protein n=1 Tax=Pseudocercospora eumusae TaxID=321146 RepID=A0A139HCB6_9PEZI|nr:hypothetical protein AC578_5821 [Pseudocercospora eumusae]